MPTSVNIDNLVAASISLDGTSNMVCDSYGCRGVRQLALRMSNHTSTKRFPFHVAVKL
jgi:hypothetical protein